MPATGGESIFNIWTVIGFTGEAIFFSRLLVQWFLSERAGQPVIPIVYWYLSLIGNSIVLFYAIIIVNPVFILAHAVGEGIYLRQLFLHHRSRAAAAVAERCCPHCGKILPAETLIAGPEVP